MADFTLKSSKEKEMIFHIFGGQCSGKTSVVEQLDKDQFAHWDILEDFYIPEGIIKDNKMDWDEWRAKEELVEDRIKEFFEANKDKHIIIESSGMNKRINRTIKSLGTVIPVNMGVPSDKESVEFAKKKGLLPKQVKDFNTSARFRFAHIAKYLPHALTIDEAIAFINEKIK